MELVIYKNAQTAQRTITRLVVTYIWGRKRWTSETRSYSYPAYRWDHRWPYPHSEAPQMTVHGPLGSYIYERIASLKENHLIVIFYHVTMCFSKNSYKRKDIIVLTMTLITVGLFMMTNIAHSCFFCMVYDYAFEPAPLSLSLHSLSHFIYQVVFQSDLNS